MLQNRKKINIFGFHLPNFNKKIRGISMDRKMLYFFFCFPPPITSAFKGYLWSLQGGNMNILPFISRAINWNLGCISGLLTCATN